MSRRTKTKQTQVSKPGGRSACGCSSESGPLRAAQHHGHSHLNDLIPIAVVIAAGCEPCAEKMVRRALEQGASPERIGHVLRIVSSMQKLDCFALALGIDAIRRMEKPLAAAEKTLQQAFALSV